MTEGNRSEQRDNNGKFIKGNTVGYQLGESGNPGGRPMATITKLLFDLLSANESEEMKAIAKELLVIGKTTGTRGQIAALREIFDRIDGKVPDTHKIESDVPINIIYKQVGDREE